MNFRKLLSLLSLSSAAFGHNVSTFATDLAPHVSLSSCGTATIQVIALLQDLKLAFLQAASNLTWEDDSSGRAQDALRQVHSVSEQSSDSMIAKASCSVRWFIPESSMT